MKIDVDGCHPCQDISEAKEVDNSSLPRAKARDLTDPDAAYNDWTATTASMKQPRLHSQDARTVETQYEGDGSHTLQQRPRVTPYHMAATASPMTQSESNLRSNPQTLQVIPPVPINPIGTGQFQGYGMSK